MVTDEQAKRNVWMEALEAIHTNDANRIRSLISKGLDVNSLSPMTNFTLLRTAAFFDNSCEVVELLLELGADVNAVGPDGNALTIANGYRNIKICLIMVRIRIFLKIILLMEQHCLSMRMRATMILLNY